MKRAAPVAAAALAAGLMVSACGGGTGDQRAVAGPAREVAEVLDDFRNALASRDFGRICRVLLAAQVRRQAGGRECPRMLRRTATEVRKPVIRLESLEIRGDLVTARVITAAAGQPPVADTMELVREGGRFRISSLSR